MILLGDNSKSGEILESVFLEKPRARSTDLHYLLTIFLKILSRKGDENEKEKKREGQLQSFLRYKQTQSRN